MFSRYFAASSWKTGVTFESTPSKPRRIDRSPSIGRFAMMVSVIIFTWAALGDLSRGFPSLLSAAIVRFVIYQETRQRTGEGYLYPGGRKWGCLYDGL